MALAFSHAPTPSADGADGHKASTHYFSHLWGLREAEGDEARVRDSLGVVPYRAGAGAGVERSHHAETVLLRLRDRGRGIRGVSVSFTAFVVGKPREVRPIHPRPKQQNTSVGRRSTHGRRTKKKRCSRPVGCGGCLSSSRRRDESMEQMLVASTLCVLLLTLAIAIFTALATTTIPWVLPPSSRAESLLSWTTAGGTQSGALSAPCVMILMRPWLPPLLGGEWWGGRGRAEYGGAGGTRARRQQEP